MYTEEAEEALLGGHPDFVLDAIDNINTKVSSPPGRGSGPLARAQRMSQPRARGQPCWAALLRSTLNYDACSTMRIAARWQVQACRCLACCSAACASQSALT